MTNLLVFVIKAYKILVSPLLPFNHCRFLPTCSEYAIEALTKHGWLVGSWLSLKRILRCHPYHKHSGYDPVPDRT
jgi:putative membrane protein insertion efficiency factor